MSKARPPDSGSADARLQQRVRQALGEADPDTVAIVAACAGLLATVAYADRDFSAAEAERAERLLGTVQGIGPAGARALVEAVQADGIELSTVHSTRFCRTLKELGHRELRLHILGMLVDLAAADGTLSADEVTQLRQLTQALGLEQADYNRLQAPHRAKLTALD